MRNLTKLAIILTAILSSAVLTIALRHDTANAYSESKTPVYRFYHYKTSSHFYTTSASERNRVESTMKDQYRYEGQKFYGWTSSNSPYRVPVYRFYRHATNTHFYTVSPTESDRLRKGSEFRYEGIPYFAQSDINADLSLNDYEFYGQCPINRFYNFNNKTHFYSTSITETDNVAYNMYHKYRYEGMPFFVWQPNCLNQY